MKRISLDTAESPVKDLVRSLSQQQDGVILELEGTLVVTRPLLSEPIDEDLLREAIRARRDESRKLNRDWSAVDREVWERESEA
jgi:hypothetical protein